MWYRFNLWWQRKVLLRKHVMDVEVLHSKANTPYHRCAKRPASSVSWVWRLQVWGCRLEAAVIGIKEVILHLRADFGGWQAHQILVTNPDLAVGRAC